MNILPGISVLLHSAREKVAGRRVGMLTHNAAVTPELVRSLDALRGACDLRLLLGPEHGLDGVAAAGQRVGGGTDRASGLPVASLYGSDDAPSAEHLAQIDLLVCDLQDIGVRYYTYAWTLLRAIEAAGKAGVPVLVLDRPNPLGGAVLEGPLLRTSFSSLVGQGPLPIRHGLTLGELALFCNEQRKLGATVEVLPAQGWRREQRAAHTHLPWVPPSPNMPSVETALLYPGTCLVEGTNLSEGRGTVLPFQHVGAPWVDGAALAAALNGRRLPGVLARATAFAPLAGKHAGQRCEGVQLHIIDADALRPVALGVELLAAIQRLWPRQFAWRSTSPSERPHIDLLWGNDALRVDLDAGIAPEIIIARADDEARRFGEARREYLLYA